MLRMYIGCCISTVVTAPVINFDTVLKICPLVELTYWLSRTVELTYLFSQLLLTPISEEIECSRSCSFLSYRGIDLDGNTVGFAFVGTMCGPNAVGITQDGGRSIDSTASTAAHELGHIFNMNHDDAPSKQYILFHCRREAVNKPNAV